MRTPLNRTGAALVQGILYARISTTDQTIAHQRTQAEASGFEVDEPGADAGVSGLRERPQGRRLFAMLRRGDPLRVRWADRQGRNCADVCHTIRELMRRGVIVRTVLENPTFDGPPRIRFSRPFGTRSSASWPKPRRPRRKPPRRRNRAGTDHARDCEDVYRGRKPSVTREQFDAVSEALSEGVINIAATTGPTRQTIDRIRENRAEAEAALLRWSA